MARIDEVINKLAVAVAELADVRRRVEKLEDALNKRSWEIIVLLITALGAVIWALIPHGR